MSEEIKNDGKLTDAQIAAKKAEDRKKAVDKAIKDANEAEKTHNELIFKEKGYLLKTDIRTEGVLFPAGCRHKLSKVDPKQIAKMLERGDIIK